jgi:hypothetical protein
MEKAKMGGLECLKKLRHCPFKCFESVRSLDCKTIFRDRTLPLVPEKFRLVELGFESLENTI